MNFLQLGQNLARECGANNVNLTTMVAQSGENLRFVNWVAQAWSELQTLHDDWEWMRSSALLGGGVSFVPVAGAAGSNCAFGTSPGQIGILDTAWGKWCKDSFRNYVTSVGTNSEIFMPAVGYDYWRDSYMYGANRQVQTRPVSIAIAPDKSLCVGPPSNGLYTVYGDYYRAPTVMSLDADTPTGLALPYQWAIIYKGMTYYASYEAAPEVMARGDDGWGEIVSELERQYGPRVRMGRALA